MTLSERIYNHGKEQQMLWELFRLTDLWDAMQEEVKLAPNTALVEVPEGCLACQYVSLSKVSAAAGGAWINFSATFCTEEDQEVVRYYDIGVPNDLIENFTKKSFAAWLKVRSDSRRTSEVEKAKKVLARWGLRVAKR